MAVSHDDIKHFLYKSGICRPMSGKTAAFSFPQENGEYNGKILKTGGKQKIFQRGGGEEFGQVNWSVSAGMTNEFVCKIYFPRASICDRGKSCNGDPTRE